ncbi:hypothetical protein ACFSCW_02855 [Sphingomonas tabacisoli]|uniref:Sulfotransferase family protein n=1 Tax=Sphingomonas tabacisoli TaxID=2249466 RepID=A0ABW4HZM7_9SPHN
MRIEDLFATPDHYLWGFEGDLARFVPMNRAAFRRSLFLDQRIAAPTAQELRVPIDPLLAAFRQWQAPRPRTGYIFHIAHCGSTLLSRALDLSEHVLGLREPWALRQLAVAGAQGAAEDAGWREGLDLVTGLLARRYRPDEPVIVKANVPVNFVLPQLFAQDADAPAILLHLPAEAYVLAVLRTEEHRAWVRFVTDELRPAMEAALGEALPAGDVQRAAALWLAQMIGFADALGRFSSARSLDAARFYTAPAETLSAAFTLFGVSGADAEAIGRAPLFHEHAKNAGRRFSEAERQARQEETRAALANDLNAARDWLEARAERVPSALARPLVGDPVPLLAF